MNAKPWWVYACEFVIWAGSLALAGFMIVYFYYTYGTGLSSDMFWVACASALVLVGVVTSVVIIRRLNGQSGGWLDFVADMFLWTK
jgi:hypothetical protein